MVLNDLCTRYRDTTRKYRRYLYVLTVLEVMGRYKIPTLDLTPEEL